MWRAHVKYQALRPIKAPHFLWVGGWRVLGVEGWWGGIGGEEGRWWWVVQWVGVVACVGGAVDGVLVRGGVGVLVMGWCSGWCAGEGWVGGGWVVDLVGVLVMGWGVVGWWHGWVVQWVVVVWVVHWLGVGLVMGSVGGWVVDLVGVLVRGGGDGVSKYFILGTPNHPWV